MASSNRPDDQLQGGGGEEGCIHTKQGMSVGEEEEEAAEEAEEEEGKVKEMPDTADSSASVASSLPLSYIWKCRGCCGWSLQEMVLSLSLSLSLSRARSLSPTHPPTHPPTHTHTHTPTHPHTGLGTTVGEVGL